MLRLRHLRWAPLAAVPIGFAVMTTINDEWDNVLPRAQPPPPPGPKEKLLILGTGWAALECLRRAREGNYDVTVVSPRPFFLYTPLLAGATVGTVHHGNIIEPIRSFLSSSSGSSGSATYIQASALHVDVGRKVVVVELPGDASLAPTVAADTDAATVAATSAASGTAAATTAAAAGSSWWPFGKAKAAVPAPALALPPGNYSSGSNSGSGANGGPAGARAELSYDKLVIAVGARPATFGIKGVEEHAFFLKELDHSAVLQQRLLACLEHASALLALRGPNCAEVHRLLHFVVVGGGPTGVELAAELSDFVATDVKRLFPSLVGKVNLTLLEAAPRVLGAFCEPLAQHATAHLAARGVAVRCRTGVTAVTGPHTATVKSLGGPAGAQADDDEEEEVLSFGALVWAAGIATRPLVHELASSLADAQAARESLPLGGGARGGGGVKGSCQPLPHRGVAVDGRLRVQGVADGSVFALGDCALSGLPPTAQVAAQQGKWLGRQLRDGTLRPIAAAGAGPETTAAADPPPFEYSDKGKMAYIGGHAAVATVVVPKLGASPVSRLSDHFVWRSLHGAVGETAQSSDEKPTPRAPAAHEERNLTGSAAFAFWRGVYFSKLLSGSNRVAVAVDWARAEVFGRDVAVHQAQMRRHQTTRRDPGAA